jgi:PAS domain S-box-containing protein
LFPGEVLTLAVPRIARICALGLGMDELLGEVCREILVLCGAEGCQLVSLGEEAEPGQVWHSFLSGEWPDPSPAFRPGSHLEPVLERLRSEGPMAADDLETLPPDHPLLPLFAPLHVRAVLLFPLKFGTRLIGLLSLLTYSGPRGWRGVEVQVVAEVVAPILSAALERRRMEGRLRESETRYRFLADNALDFISLHDLAGKYLYASPAARRMLGYRPEEMMGVAVSAFLHPDDQERFDEGNRRLVSGEVPALTLLHRLRGKEGAFMEVETVSSPVLDERGAVRQILRVTRDVTERKKVENRLFESQKLETIGMLAGGVAHEFNNLLLGINGAVEMLALLLAGNPEAQNYLSMIERSGARAVELTHQLLAYARKGKHAPTVVLLNHAILENVPILKAALPASVEFRLDLDEGVPPMLADIAQLKQVVMSLCLNAGEAMPEGGILSVRTRREEEPPAGPGEGAGTAGKGAARQVRSGNPVAGPRAVLEVSDTGCGMDADTLDRIFEPFFSTKFIGRGMGLAAVLGIVESHDGEILVRSEPGKGTAFRISFPATSGIPAVEESNGGRVSRGAGMILVADDEDDVREVVCAMLKSFGYGVIEARDGVEAVERFRERLPEIDLVLLDLMMPRMTGDRVFAEMRRIYPGVRAILASGYDESGRVRDIVADGFGGFLQKPFRRRELGRKVEEVLGNPGSIETAGKRD